MPRPSKRAVVESESETDSEPEEVEAVEPAAAAEEDEDEDEEAPEAEEDYGLEALPVFTAAVDAAERMSARGVDTKSLDETILSAATIMVIRAFKRPRAE